MRHSSNRPEVLPSEKNHLLYLSAVYAALGTTISDNPNA
jgi:hypothetical protein